MMMMMMMLRLKCLEIKKSDHKREKKINLIRATIIFYRLSFENHLFYVNPRSPCDIDQINNRNQREKSLLWKKDNTILFIRLHVMAHNKLTVTRQQQQQKQPNKCRQANVCIFFSGWILLIFKCIIDWNRNFKSHIDPLAECLSVWKNRNKSKFHFNFIKYLHLFRISLSSFLYGCRWWNQTERSRATATTTAAAAVNFSIQCINVTIYWAKEKENQERERASEREGAR